MFCFIKLFYIKTIFTCTVAVDSNVWLLCFQNKEIISFFITELKLPLERIKLWNLWTIALLLNYHIMDSTSHIFLFLLNIIWISPYGHFFISFLINKTKSTLHNCHGNLCLNLWALVYLSNFLPSGLHVPVQEFVRWRDNPDLPKTHEPGIAR